MQTIIKGNSKTIKILGEQKRKNTTYRLMNYVFESYTEDGVLLFNAITAEMIHLEHEESKLLASLPSIYSSDIEDLIKAYYLVPEDYDESQLVIQIRSILRALDKTSTITGYTILPTTFCNARCYYCYEAGIEHIHMSEETANSVIEFIVHNHGDEDVSLNWFGGEPTLGEARIDQICKGLIENKIAYKSTMISNGYLFDEKMVQKAVELWKLKRIQITLDGTEEIYNHTKAFKHVKDNPYQRVLRNIKLFLDQGIFVSVRTNLSNKNVEDLKALAGILRDKFRSYNNFYLYSHILFDGEGFEPVRYSGNEENNLLEQQIQLNREIQQWNKIPKKHEKLPALRYRYCMADGSRGIIISPNGDIAKCEHIVDDMCGSILDGQMNEERIQYWKEYDELTCRTCKYFPYCIKLLHCQSQKDCLIVDKEHQINSVPKLMADLYIEKRYKL